MDPEKEWEWFQAMFAWENGNRKLLGDLISSNPSIPLEVRTWLGGLLGRRPGHYVDGLELVRSKALHRSIQTFGSKVEAGMMVLSLVAQGTPLKKAKAAAEKRFAKSASYIDHCMTLARRVESKIFGPNWPN